jgi:fimbrial chaperone protein
VDFKGLRVALRVGVPVFVVPDTAVSPALRWRAVRAADGWLNLAARNEGNAHVQLVDFRLESAAGQELGRQQTPSYVLPGQSREWRFKASPPAGAPLRVVGRGDAGEIKVELTVDGR